MSIRHIVGTRPFSKISICPLFTQRDSKHLFHESCNLNVRTLLGVLGRSAAQCRM